MNYITVSIGNTDNRLTQQEWSRFVEDMIEALSLSGKVHFFGGASTWAPWQNVAWIVELQEAPITAMARISNIRKKYKQDSAFVLFGNGEFI